jgi:hypothetical protein
MGIFDMIDWSLVLIAVACYILHSINENIKNLIVTSKDIDRKIESIETHLDYIENYSIPEIVRELQSIDNSFEK